MSRKKKAKREGKKRPSQPSQPKLARDRVRLERQEIEDPYDSRSKVEVTRTVDTITMLHRRGQIDRQQYRAADTYRHAAEVCGGGIPCALDQSTVRSGNNNHSPTEAQMRAAGLLSDASRILGLLDGRIVSMIVVEGYSIEQAAARIFGVAPGGKAKRGDTEHTGRRLRLALTCMADVWWPGRGPRRVGIHGR